MLLGQCCFDCMINKIYLVNIWSQIKSFYPHIPPSWVTAECLMSRGRKLRLVVWSPSSEVEYLCLLSVSITVFGFINRVIIRLQIGANKLVLVNLSSKKFKIIRIFLKFYFSGILQLIWRCIFNLQWANNLWMSIIYYCNYWVIA